MIVKTRLREVLDASSSPLYLRTSDILEIHLMLSNRLNLSSALSPAMHPSKFDIVNTHDVKMATISPTKSIDALSGSILPCFSNNICNCWRIERIMSIVFLMAIIWLLPLFLVDTILAIVDERLAVVLTNPDGANDSQRIHIGDIWGQNSGGGS